MCDAALASPEKGACKSCSARLEYVREPKCSRCGKPLETAEEYCQDCREKAVAYQCGRSLFVYDSAMQSSIARFKYEGRREYAGFYAKELFRMYGDWMQGLGVRAFVPVPIHGRRLRRRGYNQAELIANELGELAGLPVRGDLICRCRETIPQKELSVPERRRNLEGGFRLKKSVEELNQIPECVIIIDDIYTTGSTIEACSRALQEAGIQNIYFLCVCIGKGL